MIAGISTLSAAVVVDDVVESARSNGALEDALNEAQSIFFVGFMWGLRDRVLFQAKEVTRLGLNVSLSS